LPLFAGRRKAAQNRYESFVADKLNEHSPASLSCGGRRSSRALDPSIAENAIFDDRILGGGHFVEQVLHDSRPEQNSPQMSLSELVERVAACLQIAPGTLNAPSKERHIVRAKAIICHLAVRKLGIKGLDVAAILGYIVRLL